MDWREQQNYYLEESMLNYFSNNLVSNRFNLKTFVIRERPCKYNSGTVHYENPLANQNLDIDEYGCLVVKQKQLNKQQIACKMVEKNNDQLHISQNCEVASRQSTKQQIFFIFREKKVQEQKDKGNKKNKSVKNVLKSQVKKTKKIAKSVQKIIRKVAQQKPMKAKKQQKTGVVTRSVKINKKSSK